MIDVYFWPTGNGKKITIMLEECGLPYNVIPVNINKGDQSTPEYDAINPNNKMPDMTSVVITGRRMKSAGMLMARRRRTLPVPMVPPS